MRHVDRVYGEVMIRVPEYLDVIRSPYMQRLKHINHFGYFAPFFPNATHTRYEHSLGVFALLKRARAPARERMKGLIHDIPHPVTCHSIDYALDEGCQKTQSYQDDIFVDFVKETDIPAIFAKYHIDFDYMMDDSNFPLLEREYPDLCADRIDNSLRDAVVFGEIDREEAMRFINSLNIVDSRWVFKNYEIAREYSEMFRMMNNKYWAGFPIAITFDSTGKTMRFALERGYVKKEDLWTTDEKVFTKLRRESKNDGHLAKLFKRMNNEIKVVNDPDDFESHIFCKSRIVDPFCKEGKEIVRVSDVDPEWNKVYEEESKPKEYFLRYDD